MKLKNHDLVVLGGIAVVSILLVTVVSLELTGNVVREQFQYCQLEILRSIDTPESVCDDAFIDPERNDYIRGVSRIFDGRLLTCVVPCTSVVKEQCWSTTGMFISYVANNPLIYKVLTPAVVSTCGGDVYEEEKPPVEVSEERPVQPERSFPRDQVVAERYSERDIVSEKPVGFWKRVWNFFFGG